MCCAIMALLLAAIAAARRRLNAALDWRPHARNAAAAALLLLLGVGSAAAARHFAHYAGRAEINHRSVLAEMLAQPICSGSVSNENESQVVRLD